MKAALPTALRESSGYLEDEGWHQTAQLMTLAAEEIERLTERVQELEAQTLQHDVSETAPRVIQIASGSRAMR
jgi:hypothetical protein